MTGNASDLTHKVQLPAALIAGLALLATTGCGFPISGPRGEAVERTASVAVPADSKPLPYCLVPVTPRVVDIVARHRERLAGRFTDHRPPPNVQIGTGDVLSVTLFESAAGGLFFPVEGGLRTGNFLTIPPQIVDEKGDITIPYAGQIRARGRTAQQIQVAIVDALKDRALEPQAVVTVVERRNAQITVLGVVGTGVGGTAGGASSAAGAAGGGGVAVTIGAGGGARLPASISGERVLDAIARAGGLGGPGQSIWVMVERDQKVAVAPFEALVYEPENNIYVRPQDVIYLYTEPQTFLAFGATGRQAQVTFDSWRLSLAEALAKAGGLLDERAEPSWLFLYRAERQNVAQQLNPKCAVTDGKFVPVIYELNLRDPAAMFLATQFPMRNKDVMYASNARTVESTKFLTYVSLAMTTLEDPISVALASFALQSAVRGTATSAVLIGGGAAPASVP